MTLVRRNHGTGHSYKADGVKQPGVTTIIGTVLNKAKLNRWYSTEAADYAIDHWDELAELLVTERRELIAGAANANRDALARRGTQVHKLAEQLVAGAEVEPPEPLRGHVESYARFLDHFDPDPIAIELVVCHREVGYCGTADLVAHMLGQVWLLELKTARSGIFRESALQACAYSRAETYALAGDDGTEHPLAGLGIERCGSVHIRADGCDLRPLDTGETTWAYFQRLAWLYHHEDDSGEWVGDLIDPPPLEVAS